MEIINVNHIRKCILNNKEPLIIKNTLKWNILNLNLEKWTELLGNEQLLFRAGKKCATKYPQFENSTQQLQMTFAEFVKYAESHSDNWLYFDYKHLFSWLTNLQELRDIDWRDLGFPEVHADDSTIWIGSEGSHTPCHQDTYGCNMIAQVYGCKRWIIFPPTEDLKPIRTPLEESSIYSKYNFFSPNLQILKDIRTCRTVVLQPGDVLLLPHKWWHYAENLDLGISVNTWIPLPIDEEERLNESIVHALASSTLLRLRPKERKRFANDTSSLESFSFLQIEQMLTRVQNCKEKLTSESENNDILAVTDYFENVHALPILSCEQFNDLMKQQSERFHNEFEELKLENQTDEKFRKILNAMLHPEVIDLIKKKLLE